MRAMSKRKSGQALIEFVFVLLFIITFSVKTVTFIGDFMRDSFGNLAHVISLNITVGTCANECFFSGYANGYRR